MANSKSNGGTMELREVELPNGVKGKLFLSNMVGRGSNFDADEADIIAKGISCVVRLTPDEEVRGKSPVYYERITNKMLKWEDLYFPIFDYGVPDNVLAFANFVSNVANRLKKGESIDCHCGAGIGRSGTVAVAVLIKLGIQYNDAVGKVIKAGSQPENDEQVDFVLKYSRLSGG